MTGYVSVREELDWTRAGVIAAGVDSGAVSTKAVIMLDRKPYAFSQTATRIPGESADRAIRAALDKSRLPMEKIDNIVATGRGRARVSFARESLTEIACGPAGAVHIWGPSVRTVLDAGGESCRVIHCTERGRATDFLWNDKCAAGIGRYMETFADLVQQDLTGMGNKILPFEPSCPKLSDFCAVYAQSEALDLIRSKVPLDQVITAYHHAMSRRISTLVARAGMKKEFVIIGGLARNQGIVRCLGNLLDVSPPAPGPGWVPAFATALGAALFADSFHRKNRQAPQAG